jgi:hypothetical protein
MRRSTLSLVLGSALVACLAIGAAGSARAATLDFTGTLTLQMPGSLPAFVVPGAGTAQVSDDGNAHLLSFLLPGGTFGPITTTLPVTTAEVVSVRLSLAGNLSGSFGAISGGPPGGGPMGLQGLAKICLPFGLNCSAYVPFPLTPTTGGAGFGIGGTRTVTGAVDLTLQNAPWTIGQPTMTLHTAASTISVPTLPGGFAHGPASLASSTAQPSGAVQLVTVSKVFTSLTGAFPEGPLIGVLTLHFVPEPGTVLLLGSGVAGLAVLGRRKLKR